MLNALSSATTEAVDDYLKAILELGGSEDQPVSSNALAERLNVRAASVSGMLQKLAVQRPALVVYQKHRGVKLSAAGKRRAWELVRHHRLLELFLHDVLHFSWDEVHEEAERLEHFISERFEDRVAAILGDPAVDPHGHLIPPKDILGNFANAVPLSAWALNTPAVINSVSDRDPAVLRELQQLGLKPGVSLAVVQVLHQTAYSIRLLETDEVLRVSRTLANCVFVAAPQIA